MNIHILALATIAITIHTTVGAIGADDMSEELLSLVEVATMNNEKRGLKGRGQKQRPKPIHPWSDRCNEPVPLDHFPQWRDEVGYWIGEYSYYGADGTPNESDAWNYRYDNYRGFITGNINGTAYRQRNVFLYPPQTDDRCEETNDAVVGAGTCGLNGNIKLFDADQSGESCDGSIEGPFGDPPFVFDTFTTLVGKENAVLYQIFAPGGGLYQSQLTTLSGNEENKRRTRTAQLFTNAFIPDPELASIPTYASFYRERRVTKEEFYDELEATLEEYNILDEDICTRNLSGVLDPEIVGGIDACRDHLEESFALTNNLLDSE